MRQVPHRRRRPGLCQREARRHQATRACRNRAGSEADPAGRAHASWGPGSHLPVVPPAVAHRRRSHSCDSRVCRRRRQHRDGHCSPDVHGWPDVRRSLDSLARRPRQQDRVRRDRRRSADDHLHQSHRCEGPGQGIPRGRRHRSGDQQRYSAGRWTASTATTRWDIPFHRRPNEWSTGPSRPER